ncbi:MAG: helix-turn-helix transcriptional regulator [Bacillota bacterium]|jgi:transcriptional regulator with XRE-family HTH domain|nr:helix-turn-helix transcriptional regulator [Bacillota bacterium]NLV63119.1 helix-turn-helix transcriptional regulator [Clostridiaceae bacterium]
MKIKAGEIIRAKREEKNIPLVSFAKELNISPGYLSQLENGVKTNPNLDILMSITQKLDIDLEMLLGVESSEENYLVKIPSLLKLVLARERNSRVLSDPDILRKYCKLAEKIFDTKYLIEDSQLYNMFIDDLLNQAETLIKRYLGLRVLMETRNVPVETHNNS